MLQQLLNKKSGALVLAGLAAFAYYKYSKMSAAEKANLTDTIKEKGKNLWGQVMPGEMKNAFANANKKNEFTGAGM